MGKYVRSELQQEVVDAILDSGAVNFEAIGTVLAKYGDRAARTGTDVAAVIGWRVMDLCIPPFDRFNFGVDRLGVQPEG